ncbi:hypothetical protein N7493_008273 [Penicillium malachiteum]|uniref:Uncharacterized protein n=1 Tax=Penicillium malachiteum TaxID=1324776 RepID=A0AAD6HGU6_9EURO|nr:hypothetical protein N7493_008273 [Penicillium malachiteum]
MSSILLELLGSADSSRPLSVVLIIRLIMPHLILLSLISSFRNDGWRLGTNVLSLTIVRQWYPSPSGHETALEENVTSDSLGYTEMRLIVAKMTWSFDMTLDMSSDKWNAQKSFGFWRKPPFLIHLTKTLLRPDRLIDQYCVDLMEPTCVFYSSWDPSNGTHSGHISAPIVF